ncbi:uncharacterized protein LY89DRAFT_722040 [Mollisia scopiformis]|uniref:DUF6536 domain-containing protein n=1 Tax=Mollisia scopiformis TaxID=149040 RepID=A0A194WWR1_MOLSC|nr:uncharacterized protein LY89DRAFT_722040 [Mollisia scopiformis]KUJ12413.1 hypothetical protein LY89DRAFT_722040 [Mollisia scopiformis]
MPPLSPSSESSESSQHIQDSSEQYLLSDLSHAASSSSNLRPAAGFEEPTFPSPTIQKISSKVETRNHRPKSDNQHSLVDAIQPNDGENEREEESKKANNWRVRGFASKKDLTLWFPQIGVDEHESWRIWMSKRSQALLLHTITVAVILIANFALTVFALSHYTHFNGVGTIFQGSCTTAKQLDRWLHLLINLLGTGMLMASNYCMQLQAAPTRANIDRAHENDTWLDIGVPSLRNFAWIGNWRRVSWLLLAASSLPLHLIYNSAVFTSLASSDYTVAVVNSYFLNSTSSSWNLTAAASRGLGDPGFSWVIDGHPGFGWKIPILTPDGVISGMQQNATNTKLYTQMNVSDCFTTYSDYFIALGDVIIVTKNDTRHVQQQMNDTLLILASIIPNSDGWAKNQWAIENGTQASTKYRAKPPNGPVQTWYLGPSFYEVDYCLVQLPSTTADRCRFEYSPQIMITVCILNLIKTSIMLVVWWLRKYQWTSRKDHEKHVLYTLGDAIQSFVRHPEPKTEDMCLAGKSDFIRRRTRKTRFVKPELVLSKEPRKWKQQERHWASAASVRRWVLLISICLLVLIVASALLGIAVQALAARGFSTSISSLASLGFGALQPYTYLNIGLPRTDPAGLISNILIANFPQLVLSILYLFYNAMMSCFLVQLEFSQMYRKRKPLRVSEPEGIQRSSYFISLPLKYGIPLYISSGIMHWLISQSLFLARITAFFPDGSVDDGSSFSTCGYSPIALFTTILVGITLVIGVVALGFRKYEGTMPLVSTNSLAISAACHALQEDRGNEGHLLPMQWGVVSMKNGVGHCTFSTAHDNDQPDEKHTYV